MVNVSKLKVVEIKAELVARGLPTSGLKAVLAQRLTEALQAEEQQKTTAEGAHLTDLGLTSTSELLPSNSIDDPIPSAAPNKSTTPSPNSRKRKQPLASTDPNPLPSKLPCSSRPEMGTSETYQKPELADQLTTTVLPDSTVVGRSEASPISTEPHETDNHQPDQSDLSEIAITPSLAQVPPPKKNEHEMASVTIARAELIGHPDQTGTPESSTGPLKPSTTPTHNSALIEARDPESESAIPSAVVATGIASKAALSVTVTNVDQTPPNTAPHVDKTELAEKLHVDSSQQQAIPMPAENLTVESADSNVPESSESAVTIVVRPNDDSNLTFDHNPDTIVELIPETSHLPDSDNLNTKPIGSNAASLSRSDLNPLENVPAVTAHDEKLDTDLTPPSVDNFSPLIPSQTVTPACSIAESSSQLVINLSGHTPLTVTPHIRATRSPSVIIENTGKHDQESMESQSMMPTDSNDSDLRASSQRAERTRVALTSVPEPSPKPSTSQVNSKQPISIETNSSLPDASSTTPPPNKSLYINNLVRPLTIPQIRNMLSEFGELQFFWIDSIRSHVYVTYAEQASAEAAYGKLHQTTPWPPSTGKILTLVYLPPEKVIELTNEEENSKTTGSKARLELIPIPPQNEIDDWKFILEPCVLVNGIRVSQSSRLPLSSLVSQSRGLTSSNSIGSSISTITRRSNIEETRRNAPVGESSLRTPRFEEDRLVPMKLDENPKGGPDRWFQRTKTRPSLYWSQASSHPQKPS